MIIEEYLDQYDLTIVKLAKITGQSRQTLCNWYNNKKKRNVFKYVVMGVEYEKTGDKNEKR